MANVVKKHSISSELAQKMVDEGVSKAQQTNKSLHVGSDSELGEEIFQGEIQ